MPLVAVFSARKPGDPSTPLRHERHVNHASFVTTSACGQQDPLLREFILRRKTDVWMLRRASIRRAEKHGTSSGLCPSTD